MYALTIDKWLTREITRKISRYFLLLTIDSLWFKRHLDGTKLYMVSEISGLTRFIRNHSELVVRDTTVYLYSII